MTALEPALCLVLASTCDKICSTGHTGAHRHHTDETLLLVAHFHQPELMTLLDGAYGVCRGHHAW